jgi:pyruvate/2-oxoglutarate dehydrogenase complex dihydrolipoamide dehydrogenase (E3) component
MPSSEIIYGMAIAIERRLNAEALSKVVFPHPSVGEVLRDAVLSQI